MRKSLGLIAIGALLALGAAVAWGQGLGRLTGTETQWRNSIFQVGMLRLSRDENLTATPSGTVSTSLQLVWGFNRVTTVASSGDGVRLPPCVGGRVVVVANAAAANALNLFPNTSTETINALSAGSAFSLAANKMVIAICGNDGNWYTNLTASLDLLRLADNRKGLRHAA